MLVLQVGPQVGGPHFSELLQWRVVIRGVRYGCGCLSCHEFRCCVHKWFRLRGLLPRLVCRGWSTSVLFPFLVL